MVSGNILIVWDRIGDYHRARIRALEERAGPGHVFTADFGGNDDLYGWENTEESQQHYVLSSRAVDQLDIWRRVNRFWKLLREKEIQNVAIAGYGRFEYVLFIKLARFKGCRVTLFAESWYGQNRLLNWAKGLFLNMFCHKFLVSGSRARDHFHQQLGIPLDRILTGYSVVDNDHFSVADATAREPILLCVARFSPEKNLGLLISTFLQSKLADSWRLRLIGGGPEEEKLRKLAADSPRVEFAGWVGYADLPGEYARAGYFVLPSTFEPWGLVVNEAMAAGLPVICSVACGCQPDLVAPDCGYSFQAGDAEELSRILNHLPEPDSDPWTQLSRQAKNRIAGFSSAFWANQLLHSFK